VAVEFIYEDEKSIVGRRWKIYLLAPPIWMEIMGLSKKYFCMLSLILCHFLEQFMAPPFAMIT